MTLATPTRILVILDNCGPADGIRMSFALTAIRHSYPDAELVFLIAERAFPAFQDSKLWDKVVISRLYEQRSSSLLRLRLKKVGELIRLPFRLGPRYDLVVTLGWGTTLLNLLAWRAGRRRIGYENRFPSLLSSHLGRYDFNGDMVEQNMALLNAAGILSPGVRAAPTIHSSDDTDVVHGLLKEYGLNGSTPLVVCHPGSDWACQQWLPDRWAELADTLASRYGAAVVFTGQADERAYIDAIRAHMSSASITMAGRTTLPQLGALVASAHLVVCVDSVIHDLTLAGGTRAVVLAGPSDWQRPPNTSWPPIIVQKMPPDLRVTVQTCKATHDMHGGCLNYSCPMAGLRDIAVTDVLQAIESMGAGDRPQRPLLAEVLA